jgi:hypothetical protein
MASFSFFYSFMAMKEDGCWDVLSRFTCKFVVGQSMVADYRRRDGGGAAKMSFFRRGEDKFF